MDALSGQRPIFHSEADFQHALAWHIHTSHRAAALRLEVPFSRGLGQEYLDCMVRIGNQAVPIELKYKTRAFRIELNGEEFVLKNQGAQDLGRYDFFRDVGRVEHLF